MNLHEVTVHRFGAVVDRTVGPFRPGLNVLYGPNEAGKTTLFRFVRGVLHGYRDAHRRGLLGTDGRTSPGRVEVTVDDERRTYERDVDGESGRLRIEPPTAPLPPLAESLGFFHPYEPGTLHALVAAATEHGIDLRARTWSSDELDRLDAIVTARGQRVTRDLQGLLARNREHVGRIGDHDRRDRERHNEFEARRTEIEERRTALGRSIADAHAERDRLRGRLKSIESRRDEESRERCLRTSERARRIEEHLTTLAELDARIERARRVVTDLDTRVVELNADVERATAIGGPAGDPTVAVHELEAEVDRLAEHGRRCRHCGGGHDSSCCEAVRSVSETLRERVYRLCELVGRREAEARAIAAREELRELDCCRRGLRTQLKSLAERRSRAAEALSGSGVFALLGRAPGTADFCRCERHRAFLDSLRARLDGLPEPHPDSHGDEPSVGSNREAGDLRRHIDQLSSEIERDERRLAELEGDLRGLGAFEANDHDSIRLRSEIALTRSRFGARAAEFGEVERQRTILADLRAEGSSGGESTVIADASAHLHRLTLGHCPRLRVTDAGRVEVHTASRGWVDHDGIGAGTQHVVGLALRLAIAEEFRRRGTPIPLMLDDVLVDNDLGRQRAAVELLADAAGHGQQIVLLTCHLHLREACRSRGGHVLEFGGPGRPDPDRPERDTRRRSFTSSTRSGESQPRPPVKPRPNRPTPAARAESVAPSTPTIETPAVVEHRTRTSPEPVRIERPDVPSSTPSSSPAPLRLVPTEGESRSAPESERFGVDLGDNVRRLPGMTRRQSRLLGLAGVRTVGDLLDLDLDENEAVLTGHGLAREAIARWRSQARLLVTVPGLRSVDAAALVEIGLHDAESILALSDAEFESRLGRLRESRVGRGLLQSGRRFDHDWWRGIRERAGRSRSLGRARSNGSGRSGRSRRNRRSRSGRGSWTNRGERRTVERRTRRRDTDRDRTRERSPRTTETESTTPTTPTAARTDDNEPKFYLARSSPVVDAPSIGPKTAGRFEKIGVVTVDDLLNVDPDEAAAKIAKRHISADVIRQWQAQASLVCRVPEIRGHDAQILVACGIDEPEALAGSEPKALLADVLPFCRSSAGKRIIRSGKAPDLAEVTAWISWSQHSRSLRAA